MLIDWFTVAAQIINFLILVALLKYFLYGRIIKAMDEREHHIACRLDEAEKQRQEAEDEAASYRHKHQELAAKRAELLAQAKADADARRQELLDQARTEVARVQARWHTAIQHEKAAFLRDLRQRTSQQVDAIVRRALTDLAHADLEQQMMAAFLEQLQTLDEDVWEVIAASHQEAQQPMVLHSAFDLPQEARQQLQHVLREHLGEAIDLRLETAPEVMCGIELQTNGQKIAWSLEHYLETLEESLAAAFEEEAREAAQEDIATEEAAAPANQTEEGDDDDAGA
jgi:F-type H+-transporting ATPase subunit b